MDEKDWIEITKWEEPNIASDVFKTKFYWLGNIIFSLFFQWRKEEYTLSEASDYAIISIFRNNLQEQKRGKR